MNQQAKLWTKITDVLYSWDIYNEDVTNMLVDKVLELVENAFDEGVTVAGRYGHEDNWDSFDNPYQENPYREREDNE